MKKLIVLLFLFSGFLIQGQDIFYFQKTTSTVTQAGGIPINKIVFIGDTVPFSYKTTAKISYGTRMRTAITAGALIVDTAAATTTTESDPIFAGDSSKLLHWSDSINKIATKYDLDTLTITGTSYDSALMATKYDLDTLVSGSTIGIELADSNSTAAGGYTTVKWVKDQIRTIGGGGYDSTQMLATTGYTQMPLGYSDGFVVDSIIFITVGGATSSMAFNILYGSDIMGAGTLVVTAGSTATVGTVRVSSFNNPTIAKGNNIWATIKTKTVVPRRVLIVLKGHKI